MNSTTLAGKIIKNIRKDVGITQKKMSELFGFGENTIYNWERGLNRPSFDDIHMICEFYGRTITEETNRVDKDEH